MGNVLPFQEARDENDEAHVHPLQKDVIERCVVLRSNPGETVLSPFAGVGSEVCGSLALGRRAVGVELKPSYYRQMVRNVESNPWYEKSEQQELISQNNMGDAFDEDPEIERCIRESRLEDFSDEAKAARPDLAEQGMSDWTAEEVLIRTESTDA
jgi:adenine-specific DNA methylase